MKKARELDKFIFEQIEQDGAAHMRITCWTDKLVKTNKGRFDDGSMLVKLGFETPTVAKEAEWYEIVYPPINGVTTFKSLETDETWATLNCKYCGDSQENCAVENPTDRITHKGSDVQGSFTRHDDDASIRPWRPNAKVTAKNFEIDFMIPAPWTVSEEGISLSDDKTFIVVPVCACDELPNQIFKTKFSLENGEEFPLKVRLKYIDPCGVQIGKEYSFIRE